MQQANLNELATKRDIKALEVKIEAAEADTIKWTAGMFAAQTALILGALFAVMKLNQPPAPVQYVSPLPARRCAFPSHLRRGDQDGLAPEEDTPPAASLFMVMRVIVDELEKIDEVMKSLAHA